MGCWFRFLADCLVLVFPITVKPRPWDNGENPRRTKRNRENPRNWSHDRWGESKELEKPNAAMIVGGSPKDSQMLKNRRNFEKTFAPREELYENNNTNECGNIVSGFFLLDEA